MIHDSATQGYPIRAQRGCEHGDVTYTIFSVSDYPPGDVEGQISELDEKISREHASGHREKQLVTADLRAVLFL